jgi:hypothetical protein
MRGEHKPASRPDEPPAQPTSIRREPNVSLRESILRKPLSSFYDKD